MTWVLMLDVIGALIACTSLLFVTIPNPVKAPEGETDVNQGSLKAEFRKFFMEFRQGIHEIKKRRGIMWMFIFTVFASLAMVPVSTLFL